MAKLWKGFSKRDFMNKKIKCVFALPDGERTNVNEAPSSAVTGTYIICPAFRASRLP